MRSFYVLFVIYTPVKYQRETQVYSSCVIVSVFFRASCKDISTSTLSPFQLIKCRQHQLTPHEKLLRIVRYLYPSLVSKRNPVIFVSQPNSQGARKYFTQPKHKQIQLFSIVMIYFTTILPIPSFMYLRMKSVIHSSVSITQATLVTDKKQSLLTIISNVQNKPPL